MADDVDDERDRSSGDDLITLVELLFFAYRDFTAESDAILGKDGLGRAHHRVLHFVRRQPGLRVTDLLAILKITKQSLARVLNELIEGGWIDSRIDGDDRRARRLTLTPKGQALAQQLARHQIGQLTQALRGGQPDAGNKGAGSKGAGQQGSGTPAAIQEADVRRFLFALIAEEERAHVQSLMGGAANPDLT